MNITDLQRLAAKIIELGLMGKRISEFTREEMQALCEAVLLCSMPDIDEVPF